MNETVSQKKDINTGSEILSVHVGLPEKLDLETPFQDTGSCGNSFTASAWKNDIVCTKLILSNRGDCGLNARIEAGILVSETGRNRQYDLSGKYPYPPDAECLCQYRKK